MILPWDSGNFNFDSLITWNIFMGRDYNDLNQFANSRVK